MELQLAKKQHLHNNPGFVILKRTGPCPGFPWSIIQVDGTLEAFITFFEFFLLFKRSIMLTLRSPIGIIFLIIMALGNSFILSTVFGGVGKDEIKNSLPNKNKIIGWQAGPSML